MTCLRSELTALPWRMRNLPLDPRGYPIPEFVGVNQEGERDFRFMSREHFDHCVLHRRCWVCGEKLGSYLSFVVGPMCSINRTSSEPPSHLECARWSACNCPFLTRPHMVRREDEMTKAGAANMAGIGILRNPGVTCVWTARTYRVWPDDKRRPLIEIGEPTSVEWYAEGRAATRAEVLASIDSGYPILEGIAREQRGGLEALIEQRRTVEAWLP